MSKSRVEKQYFFQLMALSSQVCPEIENINFRDWFSKIPSLQCLDLKPPQNGA